MGINLQQPSSGVINAAINKLSDNLTVPLINSVSTLSSQGPSSLDIPHIVTFGPDQLTASDPVQLLANGDLILNESGGYLIRLRAEFGRTGTGGTVDMLFRTTLNGVQIGQTTSIKIESKNIQTPLDSYIPASTPTGILRLEVMRDSSGANDGALMQTVPTLGGWASAPCASIQVYKANQLV